MTAQDVFKEAVNLGLRLELNGGKLVVIPADKCPPEFVSKLRECKTELLQWLSSVPRPGWATVPSNLLPLFDRRPCPSSNHRERVISYVFRQTGEINVGPALGAWLVTREAQYFDGPGKQWDCADHAYAAARDCACWQLSRSEPEVWELLAGFEEAGPTTNKGSHEQPD